MCTESAVVQSAVCVPSNELYIVKSLSSNVTDKKSWRKVSEICTTSSLCYADGSLLQAPPATV
jgi:hypothetical protein